MKKIILFIMTLLFLFSYISALVITVSEPKENSIWYEGQTMKIVWKSEGEPKLGVKIYWRKGSSGKMICTGVSSGTRSWKIPLNFISESAKQYKQNSMAKIKKYYIMVKTSDNKYAGISKYFIIKPLIIKLRKKI